jgi:hypothetical protein
MSPLKFSIVRPGKAEPDEEFEIDDELADQLRAAVDASPELTMSEALRKGIKHVVDTSPAPRVPPGR